MAQNRPSPASAPDVALSKLSMLLRPAPAEAGRVTQRRRAAGAHAPAIPASLQAGLVAAIAQLAAAAAQPAAGAEALLARGHRVGGVVCAAHPQRLPRGQHRH